MIFYYLIQLKIENYLENIIIEDILPFLSTGKTKLR